MCSDLPYGIVETGAPFSAPGTKQITFFVPDFPWASLWNSCVVDTRAWRYTARYVIQFLKPVFK